MCNAYTLHKIVNKIHVLKSLFVCPEMCGMGALCFLDYLYCALYNIYIYIYLIHKSCIICMYACVLRVYSIDQLGIDPKHQTMESVLQRGEKMEDLIAKSDDLSSSVIILFFYLNPSQYFANLRLKCGES
jgi:hypothetical protein